MVQYRALNHNSGWLGSQSQALILHLRDWGTSSGRSCRPPWFLCSLASVVMGTLSLNASTVLYCSLCVLCRTSRKTVLWSAQCCSSTWPTTPPSSASSHHALRSQQQVRCRVVVNFARLVLLRRVECLISNPPTASEQCFHVSLQQVDAIQSQCVSSNLSVGDCLSVVGADYVPNYICVGDADDVYKCCTLLVPGAS
jgi:hypothetical protein